MNVCPNRANTAVELPDGLRIVHMDDMCNECGNCIGFCPFGNIPYREKFTLFGSEELFYKSENEGFLVKGSRVLVREKGAVTEVELSKIQERAKAEGWQAGELILAVLEKESWIVGREI